MMSRAHTPFETLESHGYPTVRQISVFAENRCGQLLRITQLMEKKEVRVLSLSVLDSVDCAVVRLLTDDPDAAIDALRAAKFALSVSELVVVRVPARRRGLMTVWSALLSGEVNVAYAYPLLTESAGPVIAICVDALEIAVEVLRAQRFEVLGEDHLRSGP